MYLEHKLQTVNGERVYRDFGSSEWLEKAQVCPPLLDAER